MPPLILFLKNSSGFHAWPPVQSVSKPNWPGAVQLTFQNATSDRVDVEDTDGALEGGAAGTLYSIAARSSRPFAIDERVVPGGVYRFTVRYPVTDQVQKLAYVADNPEIIITG